MANDPDIDKSEKARKWLEMAAGKWRLQTMQVRSRYDIKTGEYRQLPTRVRRFLPGTPVGLKARVLELLRASAPYSGEVFDLESAEGAEYAPYSTYIRKDGPELSTGGRDATYTIVQDLKLVTGSADSLGLADESSCASAGDVVWRWDEEAVEDCPDGSQGVSYRVEGVSRDRETDLFSYAVRRTVALTVHVSPQVVECDSRRRTTVESWDNVYGEPGSFRWDPVRGGSAPLDVPEPCDAADGTQVQVSVQRNADCTYRVEVRTAEARTDADAMFSVYRDQYRANSVERTENAFAPLPRTGVVQSGGVTVRYESERNPDGTYRNTVERESELPVPSSLVEVRSTPRGTVSRRVDTNVRERASGISSEFGSYRSEATKGGLYVNEYVEYLRRAGAADLAMSCEDTAFAETHETQVSADRVPSSEHVPAASGGVVASRSYETDAEGFVVRRDRTRSEHTVEYAVRTASAGWLGTVRGYTHRSVAKSVMESLVSSPQRGTSVEARMTDGAMWDVEVRTFVRANGLSLGLECERTVYRHVHETVGTSDSIGPEAQAAGGGLTYRRSYSLDPSTGAVTVRDRTETELPVPESRRTVRVTSRGKTVRTVASNAANRPADASRPGEYSEFEVTPGGRFNVTLESVEPAPGDAGVEGSKDAFLTSSGTVRYRKDAGPSSAPGGSGGRYSEFTSRLGEDGLWERRDVEHVETPTSGELDVQVNARGRRTTVISRSVANGGVVPTADQAGRGLRRTLTRGGLWTLEETTFEPRTGASSREDAKDLFLHSSTVGSVRAAQDTSALQPTSAGSGVYRERRQRLGDDGLWTVDESEHVEQAVQAQRVEVRVTRQGRVKRTTDVGVASKPAEPAATAANVGRELVAERTRGGRYNVTVSEVSGITGAVRRECSKDAFLHTHSETGVEASAVNHADEPGGGSYGAVSCVLNDAGLWENTRTGYSETLRTPQTVSYKDAFGTRTVVLSTSGDDKSSQSDFSAESLIRSVEQEMTRGLRFSSRVTTETPKAVSSGWLHFDKTTDKGLSIYYDFVVFRNQRLGTVEGYIRHIGRLRYTGGDGSYANHPSLNISPNRFGLWDGAIALTTTYTPKAWAAGGSTKDDNLDEDEYTVKDVQVSPMNSATSTTGLYLLKATTTEKHLRGGGVGKDKLHAKLSQTMIRGSQFSYHPSGQSFQYDIITSKTVTYQVVKCDSDKFDVVPDGLEGG